MSVLHITEIEFNFIRSLCVLAIQSVTEYFHAFHEEVLMHSVYISKTSNLNLQATFPGLDYH